jgi:nematocidal protein AidA
MEDLANASAVTVDILTVINTEYIKSHYGPNKNDKTNPVGIDHSSQYMICTGARKIIGGQGTADLSFQANVGDYVSFRGTSIYQNSDDAVIVYGIKLASGTPVFNQFVTNLVTRNYAAQPDPNSPSLDGLPALKVKQNFLSLDSKVKQSGVEAFLVYIALYTLADDGQTQNLYGYYYWDPTITVQ